LQNIHVLFATLLAAAIGGCESKPVTSDDLCPALCAHEADCAADCDLIEDPSCDVDELYDAYFAQCSSECDDGTVMRDNCPAAAAQLVECLDGQLTCSKEAGRCDEERRRYHEQCVSSPGAETCPTFCSEIEVGCTPHETFGVWEDCEEVCASAARTLPCLEALYDFDACKTSRGYACSPLPASCEDEVNAVQESCPELQPIASDPTDVAFCESLAPEQCECGLWGESADCEELAANRCRYNLGRRADTCRESLTAFDACMRDIDSCDRDALRDACTEPWNAYDAACSL
jgi:hypothetical protein